MPPPPKNGVVFVHFFANTMTHHKILKYVTIRPSLKLGMVH